MYYYDDPYADIFIYHQKASALVKQFINDPSDLLSLVSGDFYKVPVLSGLVYQPRVMAYVILITPVAALSLNNFWIISVYLGLFAFLSIFAAAELIVSKFNLNIYSIGVSFLLLPSFVFWSSGLMKESLVTGCVGLVIYSGCCIALNRKIVLHLFLLVNFAIIIYVIKFYVAAIFLPMLFAAVIIYRFRQNVADKLSWFLIVLVVSGLFYVLAFSKFLSYNVVIQELLHNHYRTVLVSEPGKVVHFPGIYDGFTGIIKNTPKAFFSGLFIPNIFNMRADISLLAGIENTLVLIISFIALVSCLIKRSGLNVYTVIVFFYCILMAILLTIASPNIGTLARYKVYYWPFWVYLITSGNAILHKAFTAVLAKLNILIRL